MLSIETKNFNYARGHEAKVDNSLRINLVCFACKRSVHSLTTIAPAWSSAKRKDHSVIKIEQVAQHDQSHKTRRENRKLRDPLTNNAGCNNIVRIFGKFLHIKCYALCVKANMS